MAGGKFLQSYTFILWVQSVPVIGLILRSTQLKTVGIFATSETNPLLLPKFEDTRTKTRIKKINNENNR